MRRLLPLLACIAIAGCVTDPSALPDRDSAVAEPRRHVMDLYVGEATPITPYEGKSYAGLGFALQPSGPFTVPGPEIRIREGDTLRVTLHAGGIGHTVHWHGIKLPWAMDGVPFVTQEVYQFNNTYIYEWTAQESGTYWYHCHVEAPSHVDAGLFGALIIEPADPGQDPPFDREETMILHELDSMQFAATNLLFGSTGDAGNMPGNPFDAAEATAGSARQAYDIAAHLPGDVSGNDDAYDATGAQGPRDYYPLASIRYRPQYDTFMINAKSYPDTEPLHITSGETLRIRIINAGQLVHSMHLHGTHFLVTHKDGYLLPAPYYADTLLIGPAERYDIYVVGDNPGHWDFHDHGGGWNVGGYASNEYAFPGGMSTMLVYDDFEHPGLPKPTPGATAGDYALFAHGHRAHDADAPPASAPHITAHALA